MSRDFTLIVWGAYSTVGQRVCYELITTYKDQIHWAMAGCKQRNLDKLKKYLSMFDEKVLKVQTIVPNIRKKADVAKMVKRAGVLLACATPSREYCDIVVECCVEQRTSYFDTTEDVFWVKDVIDRFHRKAETNRVKVVNCCGVAGLPADIGLLHMVMKIRRQYRRSITRVVAYHTRRYNTLGETHSHRARRYLQLLAEGPGRVRDWNEPYLLNPDHNRPQHKVYNLRRLEYDMDFEIWKVPLALEPIGPRIIRRSVALRRGAYGTDFEYKECQHARGYLDGLRLYTRLRIFIKCAKTKWMQGVARLFKFFPGEKDFTRLWEEEDCPWELALCVMVAPLDTRLPGKPTIKKAYIRDKDHGCYTSSARLALACVMCDIKDRRFMGKSGLPKGGVLTPSVAFGEHLLNRLTTIGIMPQVIEEFIEPEPRKKPPPPLLFKIE